MGNVKLKGRTYNMKQPGKLKTCHRCPYKIIYDWASLPKKGRDIVASFMEYLLEIRKGERK